MKIDRATAPLLILVAAETVHSYGDFGPGFFDVREGCPGEHREHVKRTCLASGGWSFGIAVVVAVAMGSPVPLAIWLAGTVGMVVLYSWADQAPPSDGCP